MNGSMEEQEAIRRVAGFFEAHGAARFERLIQKTKIDDEDSERVSDQQAPVRDRCGFRDENDGNSVYYVTPEAWRTVICDGLDPDFVARLIRDRGALDVGEGNRLQKKVRLPGSSNSARVYAIRPSALVEKDQ